MGRRRRFKPQRWTASALTTLMDCPLRFKWRYIDVDRPLPPEVPILVAGTVAHDAAHIAASHPGSWCNERRLFFKNPHSFFKFVWGLWSRAVEKRKEGRGIRWGPRGEKKEFSNLGAFIARCLSGLAWLGPDGQRELRQAQRGFFQVMTEPRIPFEVLASEETIEILFLDRFTLHARVDQIWTIQPCPEFPDGGIVIVDLTLGSAVKYVQLTLYSLAFRLAVLQDRNFCWRMFRTAEANGSLVETAVAVLSLSKGKLCVFRRGPEDYENLQRWLEWAEKTVISGVFEPSPTDSVCSRCEFSHQCRFAATTEVLGLENGGTYVVTPLLEPPPPPAKQLGFAGWQRGEVVRAGRRTQAFEIPVPTVIGEVA